MITELPEWLLQSAVGAICAAVGFFARNLWDWWRKRAQSKKSRQDRLSQLDRLLAESGNLFCSQRAQAQRLLESVNESQTGTIRPGDSLDQVFSRAYPKMTEEELRLHAIIRGVTATCLKRVNTEMSQWLRDDDWFKQEKHATVQLNSLAKQLQKLELHLNEWHAKFTAVFVNDKTVALNYMADEQEHGTGFPTGIEGLVKQTIESSA